MLKTNQTGKLSATVTKNGDIIDKAVTWKSSNTEVLTIDAEGNYSTLTEGETTITVSMTDNDSITSSVNIKVENEPTPDSYEINVSPDRDYILQDTEVKYDCYLYLNGEKTDEEFEFIDVSENVPRNKYKVQVNDGNHFTVQNFGMYMNYPVIVKCVSGEHIKNIEITLRGLY